MKNIDLFFYYKTYSLFIYIKLHITVCKKYYTYLLLKDNHYKLLVDLIKEMKKKLSSVENNMSSLKKQQQLKQETMAQQKKKQEEEHKAKIQQEKEKQEKLRKDLAAQRLR